MPSQPKEDRGKRCPDPPAAAGTDQLNGHLGLDEVVNIPHQHNQQMGQI